MSLNGRQEAWLESKRLEQLRLENVRGQVRAILAACEQAINAIREPAVQQLAAQGVQAVHAELRAAGARTQEQPDAALKEAKRSQKRLHRIIADAEAAAHRWTQEQTAAKARLAEAQAAARSAAMTTPGTSSDGAIQKKLDQAAALHAQGRHRESEAACDQVEAAIEVHRKAAFDETVRREVVRGILATLTGMGFVIEGPRLQSNQADGGVVILVGRLPSGRMARFEVHVDGKMNYDFDGYQDRECGKDLEKISKTLNEKFGLRLGPPQVKWKNPDRISKGACNLPASNQTTLKR